MSEAPRREGWGTLDNMPMKKAHFFAAGGISLCGRYLALGLPRWEKVQTLDPPWTREHGTCQTCWYKRANAERVADR